MLVDIGTVVTLITSKWAEAHRVRVKPAMGSLVEANRD